MGLHTFIGISCDIEMGLHTSIDITCDIEMGLRAISFIVKALAQRYDL